MAIVRSGSNGPLNGITSGIGGQQRVAIVTQSLKQLVVTRIAIAHRLSTVQAADRIYVLKAGQIVQVGTFAELMQQKGVFVRLAARQTE